MQPRAIQMRSLGFVTKGGRLSKRPDEPAFEEPTNDATTNKFPSRQRMIMVKGNLLIVVKWKKPMKKIVNVMIV
ncbi:hypothetical protein TYRP_000103 [Tyrophagus putrescentiae]|nr:hypothetical protein TYRP_000103 [Tyrophagus putrescentiae]